MVESRSIAPGISTKAVTDHGIQPRNTAKLVGCRSSFYMRYNVQYFDNKKWSTLPRPHVCICCEINVIIRCYSLKCVIGDKDIPRLGTASTKATDDARRLLQEAGCIQSAKC